MFILGSHYCHWILIATFWPHSIGLHQAIVLIYWVGLWKKICATIVVGVGVSQTFFMVWWLFWSKALLVLLEEETVPSAVCCGSNQLQCCLITGIHASFKNLNYFVPVDVVRMKSCVNSLFHFSRVPVKNKLNLVPKQIMRGLIGMFRNSWSLSSWKPHTCIPIMLL